MTALASAGPAFAPARGAGADRRPGRVDVLGVGISTVDRGLALDEIQRWIAERERHYVCVTGVHGVMESQQDGALRDIHNASGLTVPDGAPMAWAGRWAGARQTRQVRGSDLMAALLERAAERGWSSYFYGGKEGVPELLADRLTERFPGLRVVGTYSPPFRALTPTEDAEIVARMNAAAPDLVWVGLSTPKQERWMAGHREQLDAPALLGVGAAFDMHAGNLRQAPRVLQTVGMEWAFRLACEPRRLWRRYLGNNPRFVASVVRRPPRLVAPDALTPRTPPRTIVLPDAASPSRDTVIDLGAPRARVIELDPPAREMTGGAHRPATSAGPAAGAVRQAPPQR